MTTALLSIHDGAEGDQYRARLEVWFESAAGKQRKLDSTIATVKPAVGGRR